MKNPEILAHKLIHRIGLKENHNKTQEELIQMILPDIKKFEKDSMAKGRNHLLKPLITSLTKKLTEI